jgi:hypothetical protein
MRPDLYWPGDRDLLLLGYNRASKHDATFFVFF